MERETLRRGRRNREGKRRYAGGPEGVFEKKEGLDRRIKTLDQKRGGEGWGGLIQSGQKKT